MRHLKLDDYPGEEHAIDVAIAKLGVLERLDIKGDFVSTQVIARKPPMSEQIKRPSWAVDWRHPYLAIKFVPPQSVANNLLKALEVTGWRSVTLESGDVWDQGARRQAEDLALARNIDLSIF
jgi:hypothetical protein